MFDDVSYDTASVRAAGYEPPERHHVQTIVDRAPKLLDAPLVYVHCAAGISRSTATATILYAIHMGEGKEQEALDAVLSSNDTAVPNLLMIRYADDALERGGKLLKVVEKYHEHLKQKALEMREDLKRYL